MLYTQYTYTVETEIFKLLFHTKYTVTFSKTTYKIFDECSA